MKLFCATLIVLAYILNDQPINGKLLNSVRANLVNSNNRFSFRHKRQASCSESCYEKVGSLEEAFSDISQKNFRQFCDQKYKPNAHCTDSCPMFERFRFICETKQNEFYNNLPCFKEAEDKCMTGICKSSADSVDETLENDENNFQEFLSVYCTFVKCEYPCELAVVQKCGDSSAPNLLQEYYSIGVQGLQKESKQMGEILPQECTTISFG